MNEFWLVALALTGLLGAVAVRTLIRKRRACWSCSVPLWEWQGHPIKVWVQYDHYNSGHETRVLCPDCEEVRRFKEAVADV